MTDQRAKEIYEVIDRISDTQTTLEMIEKAEKADHENECIVAGYLGESLVSDDAYTMIARARELIEQALAKLEEAAI